MATARESWVANPPSAQIAEQLNRTLANYCCHDRNPCYLRCGVFRGEGRYTWQPIPAAERRAWAKKVFGKDPSL
jgi:hypothetical protein